MKLYVCYGTFPLPEPGGHPCANAHKALREAGHEPKVIRAYGTRFLPDALNVTAGRRAARRLTGTTKVPVLVTDDGEVVSESERIVEWAQANPA